MGIGRVLLLIAALVGYGQGAMAETVTFRQQILSDMDRARLELIQASPAPQTPAPGIPAQPGPAPGIASGFNMEPQQIVAIGLGVVAGMIVLDGVIGLPTVVAAVIGGFAGNWFHHYTQRTSGAKPNPINYIAADEQQAVPLWSSAVATDRAAARP